LAKRKKIKVLGVSMGQGQEIIARKLMATATVDGQWVLLQNTHLGLGYLSEVEQFLLKAEDIHDDFRLWITAEPHPAFPIGLLQMGIKITNEAPVGMRAGLRAEFKAALPLYDEKPRHKWIFDQSVQNTVVVSRVAYTQEVNAAFDALEEGNENALKDVYQKQVAQIAALVELINGELNKNDRKKIVTLCTIDTHARDVVAKLVDRRIESATAFEWASQLRYSQNEKTLDAQVNICDAEIAYMYEYIGNCGTLVITPLTDRC
jgi:hypothetical protein